MSFVTHKWLLEIYKERRLSGISGCQHLRSLSHLAPRWKKPSMLLFLGDLEYSSLAMPSRHCLCAPGGWIGKKRESGTCPYKAIFSVVISKHLLRAFDNVTSFSSTYISPVLRTELAFSKYFGKSKQMI